MPVPKPKPPIYPGFKPDAAYVANTAQNQYQANNQLAGINRQGTIDQADTGTALQRLAQRQAQSQQNYNANSARNGSLMSGRAMQGFGYMNQGYQQQNNDMNQALMRRSQDRSLQAGQIQQQAPLQDQSERAGLIERNLGRLQGLAQMTMPQSPYQKALAGYYAQMAGLNKTQTPNAYGVLQ